MYCHHPLWTIPRSLFYNRLCCEGVIVPFTQYIEMRVKPYLCNFLLYEMEGHTFLTTWSESEEEENNLKLCPHIFFGIMSGKKGTTINNQLKLLVQKDQFVLHFWDLQLSALIPSPHFKMGQSKHYWCVMKTFWLCSGRRNWMPEMVVMLLWRLTRLKGQRFSPECCLQSTDSCSLNFSNLSRCYWTESNLACSLLHWRNCQGTKTTYDRDKITRMFSADVVQQHNSLCSEFSAHILDTVLRLSNERRTNC